MTYGVRQHLLLVQKKIVPYTPNIIAVTKYYDREAIIEAYGAGLRDFGESRAVDAIEKIESLPEDIKKNSKFHFIGHLQSNKAEKVVSHFELIHSVDSMKLAKVISESAQRINKIQKILLQVNISGEVQKFGFEERELYTQFEQIIKLPNLKVEGLMCMAPLNAVDSVIADVFSKAKQIKTELNNKYNLEMQELSMGMSNDYQIAAANGATMIRLGRILFE